MIQWASHAFAGPPDERRPDLVLAARHMRSLLEALGHNVRRDGLQDTPKRFVKMLAEMTQGYDTDVASLMREFDNDASYDEMVSVGPIPFFSLCEHHVVPIIGNAWVAYIPADGRIVGLSKLARLVDAYAQRLQVQERMTVQIADALTKGVEPKGVGVHVRARHLCMEARGVKKPGAETTTTALRGVLLEKPEARAEFLDSITA